MRNPIPILPLGIACYIPQLKLFILFIYCITILARKSILEISKLDWGFIGIRSQLPAILYNILKNMGYLLPIHTPVIPFVPKWDDSMEVSLLIVLGMLVIVQLMLLVYITISHFQPGALYRKQMNKKKRRRYCNFIFRRLLAQLDVALTHRPIPGQEFSCCRQAKQQALLAVRLFCRDTQKILHPEHELDTSAASDAYFVLDEEEDELSAAGYARLDFDVTDAFLKSLLYPKRFECSSRNKVTL